MDSFSYILSFRELHLDLNMCCFFQFYAKITTFFNQDKFDTAPKLTSNRLGETDVQMTSRRQNIKIIILMSCTRIVLHPHVR